MLSRIVLFFSIVTALALAGCSAGGSTDPDTVVAAFYPIAYAAEQISGGGVPVRNLTPAGAEPHDLELTPGDVRAIHEASVVLYLGDGFMPGLETAVRDRDGRSVDLLAQLRLQESGGAPGDPHVWLDPVRYAALVRLIGNALHDDA